MISDLEQLTRLRDRVQRTAFMLKSLVSVRMSASERRIYADAVELLTREEDDRCTRCYQSDSDGCPCCGSRTTSRLFGVDE